LRVVLPDLGVNGTWVDTIGYALLSRVRLRIGDVVVHDQERLWYDLDDKLFMQESRSSGLNRMIGRGISLSTNDSHELLIPLKFFFTRGPRKAIRRPYLPVSSIQDDIVLEIDTESFENCASLNSAMTGAFPDIEASVLVENVYVRDYDTPRMERQEIMYETVKDVHGVSYMQTNAGNFDISTVSIDLSSMNAPVRYLVFVAYYESYDDLFEYLDVIDTASIKLGNTDIIRQRNGGYFDLVQPYDRFGRCEATNIRTISFSLSPGSPWRPSGSLNFSSLSPVMRISLTGNTQGRPVKVKVFAVQVNWLDIEGGKCRNRFVV
jgi:hypothetical protein